MHRLLKTTAFVAALAGAAAIPLSAKADQITLDTPIHGATLHEADIAMSVYFTALPGGAYEVVATYVAATSPDAPQRLMMALGDGDAVRFALPGHPGTLYGFARDGEVLTVAAEPTDRQLAVVQAK